MATETDLVEFESELKKYIAAVQRGEQVLIFESGKPMALLSPVPSGDNKQEWRGVDLSDVKIHGDLNEPLIPLDDWNMLKG